MENNEAVKKIVFFGNPEISAYTLEKLISSGFNIALVVTNPAKPQGRGMHMENSPTFEIARMHDIDILTPNNPKEIIDELTKINADLFIVIAYGHILPQSILDIPKQGSINTHYSLLPELRGASPIESAILEGKTETGITIQKMALKMDAGDILVQEKTKIADNDDAITLKEKLKTLGTYILVSNLEKILNNEIEAYSQDEKKATFCKKIEKEDGLLTDADDDETKWRKFKAYIAWPRTYFIVSENGVDKRYIIKEARMIDGKFRIFKVINPNGKLVDWKV